MLKAILSGIPLITIIGIALLGIFEVLDKSKLLSKIISNKQKYKQIKIFVWIITILLIILGSINSCIELKSKQKYEGVMVSPESRKILPVYQEFPIVLTNNFDYPIYDIQLEIDVIEGDLDFSKDLILTPYKIETITNTELPSGICGFIGNNKETNKPLIIFKLPEITSKASEKYLIKIYGNNYRMESKISLTINFYSKDPLPRFSMPIKPDKNGKFTLPDTIVIPGLSDK